MHAKASHKLGILVPLMVWALALRCQAQDVRAVLTPLSNTVQVGRPFQVELLVRHPEDVVVIFPDSVKDVAPYEVKSGKPLPTRTNEGISEDVKIYDLYTWEIDSVQYLQFPVRYLSPKGDTMTVMSNRARVDFLQVIAQYSDSLKVVAYPDVVNIREPFNWKAFLVIGGGLLLLVILAFIFLSKPIRRAIKRRLLDREWRRYQQELGKIGGTTADQEKFLESLNRIWRVYFDRSWKFDFAARTTPELSYLLESVKSLSEEDRKKLMDLSHRSDMVLYAGQQVEDGVLRNHLAEVSRIMEQEYKRRKRAIEL